MNRVPTSGSTRLRRVVRSLPPACREQAHGPRLPLNRDPSSSAPAAGFKITADGRDHRDRASAAYDVPGPSGVVSDAENQHDWDNSLWHLGREVPLAAPPATAVVPATKPRPQVFASAMSPICLHGVDATPGRHQEQLAHGCALVRLPDSKAVVAVCLARRTACHGFAFRARRVRETDAQDARAGNEAQL